MAKYCSQEQIVMFTQMMQRTLDISVGKEKAAMSRHISAAGTRFRLLNCGMSLLQGDVLPKTVAKNVLRQRIYNTSLDYFCSPKTSPTQSGVALTEDIQILLRFWFAMYQDRKHIKTSAVANDVEGMTGSNAVVAAASLDGPRGPSVLMTSSNANLGTSDTRSISSEFPRASSMTTGWMTANSSSGYNTMTKRLVGITCWRLHGDQLV